MTENLKNSAGTPQPNGKRKLKRAGRAIQIWLRELVHSLLEITILFAATAVLAGILLSLIEAFWYLYLETPVGTKYTSNPSRLSPHLLTQLFKRDLFLFSIEVATATLTACLTISAAFQILALRRTHKHPFLRITASLPSRPCPQTCHCSKKPRCGPRHVGCAQGSLENQKFKYFILR